MVGKAVAQLKALAGAIRTNIVELYTTLLIVFGLPAIALIYVGIKLAFTVFVVVNVALGIFTLRNAN